MRPCVVRYRLFVRFSLTVRITPTGSMLRLRRRSRGIPVRPVSEGFRERDRRAILPQRVGELRRSRRWRIHLVRSGEPQRRWRRPGRASRGCQSTTQAHSWGDDASQVVCYVSRLTTGGPSVALRSRPGGQSQVTDSAGGDAGCPGDPTRWDPGTDRGTHCSVPGFAGPLLVGDRSGQLCARVGDLLESASLVRPRPLCPPPPRHRSVVVALAGDR